MDKFVLLYSNINGVRSKMESLIDIVEEKDPAIVLLAETKLDGEDTIKLDGYQSYRLNRKESGGGVMFLVKDRLKNILTEVAEYEEVGETKWIVIDNGRIPGIRIGILYAPQENKTKKQELQIMYKQLKEQVLEAKRKKQRIILAGDFNAKVGKIIANNRDDETKSGKMLKEFIEKHELKIMNASSLCEGIWTRVVGENKSVIDYVIVAQEEEKLVKAMCIDEERSFTPYHLVGGKKVSTDHNSILIEINWNIMYTPGQNKLCMVNNRSNLKFREKTTNSKLVDIVTDDNSGMQEIYSKWSGEVMRVAKEVYEVKRKKKKVDSNVKMFLMKKKQIRKRLMDTSCTNQQKLLKLRISMIDEHVIEMRKDLKRKFTAELANKIKKEKGFDGGVFWDFKKRYQGRKEDARISIKDSNGNIVEKPEQIKEVYANFYKKLLQEKVVDKDGSEYHDTVFKYVEALKRISDMRQIEPFTMDELDTVCKELKKKKAPDKEGWRYEMVMNAGEDLKNSLLIILNKLAKNKCVPEEWNQMVIKSISKGKGDIRLMDNRRGLFLTNIISKIMEKLFKNRHKTILTQTFLCFNGEVSKTEALWTT